jgi:triacylglycerol lipase
MTQIYLVPGFFGFKELGAYSYFHRVAVTIKSHMKKKGIDAEIIEVDTIPTASIRRRALRLIETVRENGGTAHDNLHFIGHSTGGLDIRMMLTPDVRLAPGKEEVEIGRLTRTAVTISTPHYGTPLANFFTSLNGRNLLLLISLMATSGPGRYSLYAAARLIRRYSSLVRFIGHKDNILDSLAENLLAQIRPDKGDAIWEYLRRISQDQGAMIQLTPEGMDLFNGAVTDRQSVEYISYISASPPPDPKLLIPRPGNPYLAFTHLIYAACYHITRKEHRHYPYPGIDEETMTAARNVLNFPINAATNDGVVPALSQFWGKTGGILSADHMDVVGQFQHIHNGKTYSTWMMSGSGFNEDRFEESWRDIVERIACNQKKRPGPRKSKSKASAT